MPITTPQYHARCWHCFCLTAPFLATKEYSDAVCMLRVCSCEGLIAGVECPDFYPTTWSVIHPSSALEVGQPQASDLLVPLGMPIGTEYMILKNDGECKFILLPKHVAG